ncbi:MAG: bifunctional ornithine acetyltransferase/N-acetylglutamate synthase, partial [Prosthecobacter sp.]|nr:bifunctional ornithine acetyltransferase/N-acetylglutamate synthase [Prosthecobacter sp.]
MKPNASDHACKQRVPFKPVDGGVTAPIGFRAAAVSCGIKNPEATRLDLALIVSDTAALTDAVFTTNKVRAACVRVSQQHVKSGAARAIIANSGNANACTGPQGIQDAKAMCRAAAEALGIKMRDVLVCSTGIIGMNMPIQRILPQVGGLVEKLSPDGSDDAARAIMT